MRSVAYRACRTVQVRISIAIVTVGDADGFRWEIQSTNKRFEQCCKTECVCSTKIGIAQRQGKGKSEMLYLAVPLHAQVQLLGSGGIGEIRKEQSDGIASKRSVKSERHDFGRSLRWSKKRNCSKAGQRKKRDGTSRCSVARTSAITWIWRNRRDSNSRAGYPTTAFRVRLVMTTSIRFQSACLPHYRVLRVKKQAIGTRFCYFLHFVARGRIARRRDRRVWRARYKRSIDDEMSNLSIYF